MASWGGGRAHESQWNEAKGSLENVFPNLHCIPSTWHRTQPLLHPCLLPLWARTEAPSLSTLTFQGGRRLFPFSPVPAPCAAPCTSPRQCCLAGLWQGDNNLSPCHIQSGPQFSSDNPTQRGVCVKMWAGSQGDVVPERGASQDLEGPWGAWPTGAPALMWVPSGPRC